MRKTVGIYGGSFNPIHDGHTQLGKWLCDNGYVDELWFLVSPLNPHKIGDTSLLDDETRLHLAKLAIEECATLKVCDFEMHLPRPSYMVNTLFSLRETYPDIDFILVIGADNWERFNLWYKPDEIMRHHRILVYPREGYLVDSDSLPGGVTLVDSPIYNISSTEIREQIRKGTYDGRMISPNVWTEIKRLGLYA